MEINTIRETAGYNVVWSLVYREYRDKTGVENKANSLDREATEKIRSVLSGYGMYMWCGLALGHHLLGGRGEDGCGGVGGGADVYLGGADAAAIYQLRELLVKLRASLCYPELSKHKQCSSCFYDDNGYCLYF